MECSNSSTDLMYFCQLLHPRACLHCQSRHLDSQLRHLGSLLHHYDDVLHRLVEISRDEHVTIRLISSMVLMQLLWSLLRCDVMLV